MSDLSEASLLEAAVKIRAFYDHHRLGIKPTAMKAVKPPDMTQERWEYHLRRLGYIV